MKLTFYLNVLNHHQACLADELYSMLGDDFRFVELSNSGENKGSDENFANRPYLIRAWFDDIQLTQADSLLNTSDVCVFGGLIAHPFLKKRMKLGLLCFDVGERWLKRGILNLLSPNILRMFLSFSFGLDHEPLYKLCASAFASPDFKRLGLFKGRCYKWGYFTKINNLSAEKAIVDNKRKATKNIVNIMWCARFLKLKHPELPILLAQRLKSKGYNFKLNMYGDGPEYVNSANLIIASKLNDCVELKGFQTNQTIMKEMLRHDIFLFTSNKKEGWGAVLNEAMSSGMAVVASDQVGAAPYLIEDGINGLMYTSNNLDSLEDKVTTLMDNPDYLKTLSENAYVTMKNKWSPACAARSLIRLSERLLLGLDTDIESGPCSKA